ncbi:MAG: hypothetical protein ACKODM_04075 [Cytophagales bacterium]
MKILTIVLVSLALTAKSQSTSVEKSVFGIQTGFLGIWVHNEARVTNQLAFRSEVGVNAAIAGSAVFLQPVITAEPRWYYNLSKRAGASKKTSGNSGNFFSLRTSYHHDVQRAANDSDVNFNSSYRSRSISIIPSWGIRRYFGNHFNYEAGVGIGYYHAPGGYDDLDLNFHLRLGYKF